jgi:hypothetical protein
MQDGKELGYIIVFSKSGTVVIYHGKNGADGANGSNGTNGTNGQDGHTPVIGVQKESDGIYYWTVDGKWLLDEDGNKVKAVGTDGQDGTPGQNVTDGITPEFQIMNGYWYVSYDNGVSWTRLGQATGDQGPQGPAGEGSDSSIFVEQDSKFVYLTLSDGTVITMPRHPVDAVTITLGDITETTAAFDGRVNRKTPDLKVTVYYSTSSNLTVYKHTGSKSVTEFNSNTFTLTLNGLTADTKYYYFVETVSNGVNSYSSTASFRTESVQDDEGVDMDPSDGNM